MSSSRLIPLSQILAEIILTEDQPQPAAPQNVVVHTAQVPNAAVSSSEPIEYFDDDVNHDFLPSEVIDEYRSVRCYMPLASVPKLTNMAVNTIAVALWNHVNVPPVLLQYKTPHLEHNDLQCILKEKVVELAQELLVPKLLLNLITEHITEVGNELGEWVTYCYETIFRYDGSGCWLFNLISKVVWRSDGIIDRLQTAKALVNFGNLTDVEKCYFSCAYCLTNELNLIWPSLDENNAFNYINFDRWVLRSYWRCCFKSEWNQVASYSENYMFKNAYVNNWPAKEYFFDRLTRQEQIDNTIRFIDSSEDYIYQKLLLMKLDSIQKTHVYAEKIVRIISNYCKNRVNVREIYSIWPHVRNTITFDDFVGIYKCLFESRFVGVTLLEFIWSSTYKDFKINFRHHNDHEMIDLALRLWIRNDQNDFFFTIMSDVSANLKRDITMKPFFIECYVRLICENRLASFHRLLRLCFVNLNDAKSFKRDLLKKQWFTDHCNRLLDDKKFSEFNQLIDSIVVDVVPDLLSFKIGLLDNSKSIKDYCLACYNDERMGCSKINKLLTMCLPSSPDAIAEFKRNLLMSSDGIDKCAQLIDSKTNLIPIITDSLPTNDLVIEFQERLIFSPVAVDKIRNLIKKQSLNEANECIDRYLVKEEDKTTLKKRIIGSQVEMIRKMFLKFDDSSWQSVLEWLVPTKQALDEFKSEIPLDEVFNEMLKECIFSKYDPSHILSRCRMRDDFSFDSLDRLLKWYFESDEAKINEYKFRRIDSYGEIDAIKTALKKNGKKKKGMRNARAAFDWIKGKPAIAELVAEPEVSSPDVTTPVEPARVVRRSLRITKALAEFPN